MKAILVDVVDSGRVIMRDTRSYCGILLDDPNTKPICRLRFNNTSNKRLVLMGKERDDRGRRIETQHSIETVNEITDYADQLREAVRAYFAGGRTGFGKRFPIKKEKARCANIGPRRGTFWRKLLRKVTAQVGLCQPLASAVLWRRFSFVRNGNPRF